MPSEDDLAMLAEQQRHEASSATRKAQEMADAAEVAAVEAELAELSSSFCDQRNKAAAAARADIRAGQAARDAERAERAAMEGEINEQQDSAAADRSTEQEKIPEALRDNSLFIAFTPVKNPDIAIAVVVENNTIASTVARKVLDTYYQFYPLKEDS